MTAAFKSTLRLLNRAVCQQIKERPSTSALCILSKPFAFFLLFFLQTPSSPGGFLPLRSQSEHRRSAGCLRKVEQVKECEGEGSREGARDESKDTFRNRETGCADLFDISFFSRGQIDVAGGIGSGSLASIQSQQKFQFQHLFRNL